MSEKKDRAPVILFDEIDKCRNEAVLNTISLLFDDTKNKTDFDDKFLESTIPMDEVFFICTANNIEKLPNFVLSRCTKVNIQVLS
jgi:ATP-dependent Lon protease